MWPKKSDYLTEENAMAAQAGVSEAGKVRTLAEKETDLFAKFKQDLIELRKRSGRPSITWPLCQPCGSTGRTLDGSGNPTRATCPACQGVGRVKPLPERAPVT